MPSDPNAPRAPRPSYSFALGSNTQIDDFISVYTATFDDAAYDALFPGWRADPAGHIAYQTARHLASLQTPSMEWGQVRDAATGAVVAVGKWNFVDGGPEPPSALDSPGGWDGVDEEYYAEFFRPLDEFHNKLMGNTPHYSEHFSFAGASAGDRGLFSSHPYLGHLAGLPRTRGHLAHHPARTCRSDEEECTDLHRGDTKGSPGLQALWVEGSGDCTRASSFR
jgi:hypothetical protein